MTEPRERVAILGGGIAALTAAHHLSRTPELRAKYDVTVHQMGWRLGGKLASSRQGTDERNVEHGLHVWFGCYENAFHMLEEIYRDWDAPAGFPWATAFDAFDAQNYTPIGEHIDGSFEFFGITWPELPGSPGDGTIASEPVEILGMLVGWILELIERLIQDFEGLDHALGSVPDEHQHRLDGASSVLGLLRNVEQHLGAGGAIDRFAHWVLGEVQDHLLPGLAELGNSDVDAHMLRNAVEVGVSAARGLLNPDYDIPSDWNLDRIDHLDFRTFLVDNGCDAEVAAEWSFIRAIYDAMFQYRGGDVTKPSYGAGTCLRVALRIGFTYKAAVLYLVKAGMGDVVIAPMYELLRQRGVTFEFFHKVRSLRLSEDQNEVAAIDIDVQAELAGPDYTATRTLDDGLVVWPAEPDWDQLIDGDRLKASGVDFESKWEQPAPARTLSLEQGVDFDRIILGISLGAFTPLPGDPGICAELLDANPRFARMVDVLDLVPNLGIQFWMTKTTAELGWTAPKPAVVGWSYPNDVWADMSQVLDYERWGTSAPGSLHYLCGVLDTDLYREPPTATGVQARATALGRQRTIDQFDATAATIWPDAASPTNPAGLDWNELWDPQNRTGVDRIDAQVIKANVTPTECCVGSPVGTTNDRLWADESGFTNLYLTGAWIRTGLNSTCVEAAVMSGMDAARSLSGSDLRIVGEDFLGPKREASGS